MADIIDDVAQQKEGPKSSRNNMIVKVEKLTDSKIPYCANDDKKNRRKYEPVSK